MATKSKKTKAITKYSKDRLAKNAGIGMSKVDPMDIRPPKILLMQKSSTLTDFVDHTGKNPKVGQFFHTGKLRIFETFKCNFLFAAKSKYTDRRKPEEGKKDQYQILAILAEDQSLFAMVFRGSALWALSNLFGHAKSQRIPMYAINCEIETKELSSDKNTWFVPVCRITGMEEDGGRLMFLEDSAIQFDMKADELSKKDFASKAESEDELSMSDKELADLEEPH